MDLFRSHDANHGFCMSFLNISFFIKKKFCLIFQDIILIHLYFVFTQMNFIFQNKKYSFLNNISDMFGLA